MNRVTMKAIDAIFEIEKDIEKARKLNSFKDKLGFGESDFSFNAFLELGHDKLIDFLDEYFFYLLGDFDPDKDEIGGGLASYTLFDAATPYIGDEAFNLKDKQQFIEYIERVLGEKK